MIKEWHIPDSVLVVMSWDQHRKPESDDRLEVEMAKAMNDHSRRVKSGFGYRYCFTCENDVAEYILQDLKSYLSLIQTPGDDGDPDTKNDIARLKSAIKSLSSQLEKTKQRVTA